MIRNLPFYVSLFSRTLLALCAFQVKGLLAKAAAGAGKVPAVSSASTQRALAEQVLNPPAFAKSDQS